MLCFLVPISLIVWMVVNQVQDITLRPDLIITPLKHIAALIHEKTGYNLWQEENISSMIGMIPKLGQWVVSSIFDFGYNQSFQSCSCFTSCSSAAAAWRSTAARYFPSTAR